MFDDLLRHRLHQIPRRLLHGRQERGSKDLGPGELGEAEGIRQRLLQLSKKKDTGVL